MQMNLSQQKADRWLPGDKIGGGGRVLTQTL